MPLCPNCGTEIPVNAYLCVDCRKLSLELIDAREKQLGRRLGSFVVARAHGTSLADVGREIQAYDSLRNAVVFNTCPICTSPNALTYKNSEIVDMIPQSSPLPRSEQYYIGKIQVGLWKCGACNKLLADLKSQEHRFKESTHVFLIGSDGDYCEACSSSGKELLYVCISCGRVLCAHCCLMKRIRLKHIFMKRIYLKKRIFRKRICLKICIKFPSYQKHFKCSFCKARYDI